jgi:hypothetical protein
MAMNTNLAGMSPILGAGANSAGSQQAVPGATSMSTPAIGGGTNAFLPTYPTGANAAPMTSPYGGGGASSATSTAGTDAGYGNTGVGAPDASATFGGVTPAPFAANGAPSGATGALATGNISSLLGLNAQNNPNAAHDFVAAMHKAGYSAGVAGQLWNFINSGAGYNPAVADALMAQMQPQVNRGEADIMERFGSMGMGSSSAAAIGLGDYLSQVNLNEGQVLSQLYEQSVQNYMTVLMGGKGNAPKGLFDNILGYMNAASGDMQAAATMGV